MLPLIPLRACSVGALNLDELVEKANAASERRKMSGALRDGGELERPEPVPRGVSDMDAEVLKRVREREERVRDTREAKQEDEERQAREREERASALAVQLELQKARDALESDTEDASSSESSQQVLTLDVSDEDERAMRELDEYLSDAESDEYQQFFTVEQLDSIYGHMQEALQQIEQALNEMSDENQRVVLFGVSTRLRADMRLILAIRNAVVNSRSPVVVPHDLKRNMELVNNMVRGASSEPTAGGGSVAWSKVLPIVGMLLYLLSVYLLPGAALGDPSTLLQNSGPNEVPSRLLPEILLTRPAGGLAAAPSAGSAGTVQLPRLSGSGRARALDRLSSACRRNL